MHLTETISNKDPRALSRKMTVAKRQEIKTLLEKRTSNSILRKGTSSDASVLLGRFALTLKTSEYGKTKYRARHVIGGRRGKFKQMMGHSTSTLQPSSIRLLPALVTGFGVGIWVSDVREVYLQSTGGIARKTYIKNPFLEFEPDPSQSFHLLKPLYALCEPGYL